MNFRTHNTVGDRRGALEKEIKATLPNIGSYSLDDTVAGSKNCENMIGVAQVPLGIAGPLKLSTVNSQRSTVYIPLATTEGALVASINRGCKAIAQSGGAMVDSYRVGATRGPVFRVANLQENDALNTFLEKHLDEMKAVAAKTSRHLTLKRLFSRGVGRLRYVRFVFDTQEAMGMNMATIATTSIIQMIEAKTGACYVSLAGNYDVDKKASWLNVIEGRGIKVWAEVVLSEAVMRDVLKTTAAKLFDVWLTKCMIGSAMSGSMGFNAQYANIVAALFLATGQDMAHVVEASCGITTMEIIESSAKELYVSVYLPDLMVGTVGGGTGLATQREAFSILGIAPEKDSSLRFAEVVAGAVLAGEISLLASLSEGSLTRAHLTLARGKR